MWTVLGFFWTLASIGYMISIIPAVKIWYFTQGYDVEAMLEANAERREMERLCAEEEVGCDELNAIIKEEAEAYEAEGLAELDGVEGDVESFMAAW